MPRRRPSRRPLYVDVHFPKLPRRTRIMVVALLFSAFASAVFFQSAIYLRELTAVIALSDATDMMILSINKTLSEAMSEEDYSYSYFVDMDKDEHGRITAVSADMTRINALSSRLLQDIVSASNSGELNIEIPLGNIVGSSLLLGMGPNIPVDVTMLTSSHVDLINDMSTAGINQTKHQIKLSVVIEIDVALPWNTMSTEVVHEVLIAETIIVGDVPDTYFDLE